MTLEERPSKRARLLSDDEESAEEAEGGAPLDNSTPTLRINEEYAKRFEHNKKREERHRLEEKYGKGKISGGAPRELADGEQGEEDEDEDESSTDETEDDEADLIDEDVDREISETLQALRNKDPRIYDQNVKFYRDYDPEKMALAPGARKEKPMYLQDYHRQNLMAGHTGGDDAEVEGAAPQTYAEEQDRLRREMVGSMHAAVGDDGTDADDEDDFLVAKSRPKHDTLISTAPKPRAITEGDVALADKDPETYLSNFMAAQGWRASEGSRFQPFDSDDSEDERRADVFEEAYNMRFEDPQTANETLKSYGRDVGKYGVRREEKSGRAKAREREREKKEAEKREREEEKARLRKLKIEEAEEKVKRIKEAAGLRGQEIDLQQWRDLIEGDFDDAQWDEEMRRRFGEQYYAENEGEALGSEDDEEEGKGRKETLRKPKWEDDIDIKDLVPEFDDEGKPQFSLSDEDDEEGGVAISEDSADDAPGSKRKRKKDRQQEKAEAKRTARRERRAIEEMVDATLPLTHPTLELGNGKKGAPVGFRYRATSPTSFGLSARDILFASDSQLNQYVGLKKLHAFRDSEKKQRDRKKLSKKARLRQWRKDTFGKDEEPAGGFEQLLRSEDMPAISKPSRSRQDVEGGVTGNSNVREGERKKKRKRSKKSVAVAA